MMRTITLFGPSKQPRKNHPGAKQIAYQEGQRAFSNGIDACPYTDTELKTEWERGWKIAAQRRAELR